MTDNNRRVIFSENRHASGWNIGIISIFPDILISNSLEKLSTPPDWFIFWQFLFNVMVYFSWLNDEMCQICRYAAAAASRLLDHEGLPLTRRRWGGGLVAGSTSWQLAAQELRHLTTFEEFEIIFHSLGQNVQFCSFQCKYPGWSGKSSLSLV